jgi:hypothetical protein
MKKELEKNIKEIEKLISKLEIKGSDILPVTDGIVNLDEYLAADIKIMWILKEANDLHDDGEVYGGYDMRDSLNKKTIDSNDGWRSTFNPIVYASYGIQNNFQTWAEMGNTYKDQDVVDAIKKIAFINLKKIPGNAISDMAEIASSYEAQKNIVLKQIEYYKPDVIIGGNTLQIIAEDIGISLIPKYPIDIAIKGKQLFINAYHPNNRVAGLGQENYCNAIIECVKDWKNGRL